jgi:solute carrier family 25 folate transporter 32
MNRYTIIQEQMRELNKKPGQTMIEIQQQRLSAGEHMLASALAGACTAMITNPFWLVKTRMCADRASDPNAYKSLWEGLWKTYQGEGIRGLYKGIVPALFGVSHGALQFMAYEEMKKWRAGGNSMDKLVRIRPVRVAA